MLWQRQANDNGRGTRETSLQRYNGAAGDDLLGEPPIRSRFDRPFTPIYPSPKSISVVLTRVSLSRILLACVVEDVLIRSRGILVSLHRSVAVLKNQTRPTRLYCDDPVLGCVSQE